MEVFSMKNERKIDRFDKYMKACGLNDNKVTEQLGLSVGTIGKSRKEGRDLSPKVIEKILNFYKDLSRTWLIVGEGEMIKEPIQESGLKSEEIDQYGDEDIPEQYMTYLVPMAALGGSLIGFDEEGVRREDCERVVSPIAGVDWAVPVYGDSMEPEYPNGSRVYVRKIDPSDFIAWGNVFVLDTTNGLIIKVVMQSEKEHCVKCVSLNPSGRYQPFDVPMRSIRAMYRVLLCVSVK